jgi:hypothetical protein
VNVVVLVGLPLMNVVPERSLINVVAVPDLVGLPLNGLENVVPVRRPTLGE